MIFSPTKVDTMKRSADLILGGSPPVKKWRPLYSITTRVPIWSELYVLDK